MLSQSEMINGALIRRRETGRLMHSLAPFRGILEKKKEKGKKERKLTSFWQLPLACQRFPGPQEKRKADKQNLGPMESSRVRGAGALISEGARAPKWNPGRRSGCGDGGRKRNSARTQQGLQNPSRPRTFDNCKSQLKLGRVISPPPFFASQRLQTALAL